MVKRKSLDFLPGIFRTDSNRKFLNATMDQLIQEPKLQQIYGYVGQKDVSPNYRTKDHYISESDSYSQFYQMEPGLVVKGKLPNSDIVVNKNSYSYVDMLNQINNDGGITNNHQRLFTNEFYNYTGFVDLDKLVNFREYYWVPRGPNSVVVNSNTIDVTPNYINVHRNNTTTTTSSKSTDIAQPGYTLTGKDTVNPTMYFTRGQTYEFQLNQRGHAFYIQTQPGITDKTDFQANLNTRQVLGVTNNGADAGIVMFDVPLKHAQDFYYEMPDFNITVDIVTELSYRDIQGSYYSDFVTSLNLDGIRNFNNRSRNIIIRNTQGWPALTPIEQQTGVWTLTVDKNNIINLKFLAELPRNTRVLVQEGTLYGHCYVYRDVLDQILKFPNLTAVLDKVYYQDANNPDYYGEIILVDPEPNSILHISDILGQQQYTSPNGVKFTSGLKVTFTGNVDPPHYANTDYIVENVGNSIRLYPWKEFVTPELYNYYLGSEYGADPYDTSGYDSNQNNPSVKDYMMISRASQDRNAWSRNNRWFHRSVLEYTAELNGTELVLDNNFQASRPIVEFESDLQLYNYGKKFLGVVNIYDQTTTDVFNDILGRNNHSIQTKFFFQQLYGNVFVDETKLTFTDVSKIKLGYVVTGAGIDADSVVTDINTKTKTITISRPVITDIQGGTPLYFGAYNSDGVLLQNGLKVIFNNDSNQTVRDTIYEVQNVLAQSFRQTFKTTQQFAATGTRVLTFTDITNIKLGDRVQAVGIPAGTTVVILDYDKNQIWLSNFLYADISTNTSIQINNTATQIHLIPVAQASDGDVIVVNSGIENQGKVYYYLNQKWNLAQQKIGLPQAPLYEVIDREGFSFGNVDRYPGTNFIGSPLFNYAPATGNPDKELGLPIKYQTIGNLGDICFYNYYGNDVFRYSNNRQDTKKAISLGFAIRNNSDGSKSYVNGWSKVYDKSQQKLVHAQTVDSVTINDFKFYVNYQSSLQLVNFIVKVNQKQYHPSSFSVTSNNKNFVLSFANDLVPGDRLAVFVAGQATDALPPLYEIPVNLSNNSENKILTQITLGQMRNHVVELAQSLLEFAGEPAGKNNLRDINYKHGYGKLLQHSAGLHIHALQSLNPDTNLVSIIKHNMQAYGTFKLNLLDLINNSQFSDVNDYRTCVNDILAVVSNNISKTDAYYYTDMTPHSQKYRVNNYPVVNLGFRTYNLSFDYDNKPHSYIGVLIYVNNNQLTRGRDYTINGTVVTINKDVQLFRGDVISIYEYADTTGSGIPATPSKLGLYPLYIPQIYQDSSYRTPINVIRGHDGSITPAWNDYRDNILLEYELRVYNNAVELYENDSKYDLTSVQPGAFRKTDYSRDEWNQIIGTMYLEYSGVFNIDIFDNSTVTEDYFTFNFNSGRDILFSEPVPGYWRGIYNYFFDTDTPHLTPWHMLGYVNQPDWWTAYYGPAPYTSENKTLWQDLEMGYDYGGSPARSKINTRYARPGLSTIIPVDQHGVLKAPNDFLVTYWIDNSVNKDWRIGDQSPAETSWIRSSWYPFALQAAWALTRPAEYAALKFNTRDVGRDPLSGQILNRVTNNRIWNNKLTDADEFISGTNVWTRDYLCHRNLNLQENWIDYTELSQLNLIYKIAGFTDKRHLQIIADQVSPQTTNTSIMIPEENYDVVFNKSVVITRAIYSAVMIMKIPNGYRIYGFDTARPYFLVHPVRPNGNKYVVNVGEDQATIYKDFETTITSYPYGTSFVNKQQVVDFLMGYGAYLNTQGFVFEEVMEDGVTVKDWTLSVKEFLFWRTQNWGNNTIISVTPAGTRISFQSQYGAVDTISNRSNYTKVVNSDGQTLKGSDYRVYREGNLFEIYTNDQQRGIHLLDLAVVQYEHSLVFDNVTVFNDVLFDPALGNRQYRLKIQGYKTGDWDGSLYAPGFLVNTKPILPWQRFTDYFRGDIVVYKNKTYTALDFIPGTKEFQYINWTEINTKLLDNKLIPTPTFDASQFTGFYNVDTQDINVYADTFSRHATGFSTRNYLKDLGLTSVSQHKFYLGMLKHKGSEAVLKAFMRAQNYTTDNHVEIRDQYAIKLDTFGNTAQQKFYELDVSNASSYNDQYAIVFQDPGDASIPGVNCYQPKNFLQIPEEYNKHAFTGSMEQIRKLSTAGYVTNNDVNATVFNIQKISEIDGLNTMLGEGSLIWVANDKDGQWAVYRVTMPGKVYVTMCVQTSPTELTFTTNIPHGFQILDVVMLHSVNISGSDGNLDLGGFYRISSVNNLSFNVRIIKKLNVGSQKINSLVYKLENVRFDNKTDFSNLTPYRGWKNGDIVYIDNTDTGYQVLQNTAAWTISNISSPSYTVPSDQFGTNILINKKQNYAVVASPGKSDTGAVYLYSINFRNIYKESLKLEPTDTNIQGFGSSISINDNDILAIGAPASYNQGIVYLASIKDNNITYSQILHYDFADSNFGVCVNLSKDGNYLFVGDNVNNLVYVYAYQQIPETYTESFGDASNKIFAYPTAAQDKLLTANDIIVTVDGQVKIPNLDYVKSIGADSIEFAVAPPLGKPVRLYYRSYFKLMQILSKNSAVNWPSAISSNYTGQTLIIADNQDQQSGIVEVYERQDRVYISALSQTTFHVNHVGKNYTQSISTGEIYYYDPVVFTDDVLYTDYTLSTETKTINMIRSIDIQAVLTVVDHGLQDGDRVTTIGPLVLDLANGATYYAQYIDKDNIKVYYDQNLTNVVYYSDPGNYIADSCQIVYDVIRLPQPLTLGSKVKIKYNTFAQTDTLMPPQSQIDMLYGNQAEINSAGTSVIVGSPGYKYTNNQNGTIFVFDNPARKYSEITGTVVNPTVPSNTTLYINDKLIRFTVGTSTDIVDSINSQSMGIQAKLTNGKLNIGLIMAEPGSELRIRNAFGDAMSLLGLTQFVRVQQIISPNVQDTEQFGERLSFNYDGSKLITGATISDNTLKTTFDNQTMTWDNKTITEFVDRVYRSGSAHIYEYQTSSYTNADAPGKFVFATTLSNNTLSTSARFGTGVALSANWAVVGSPNGLINNNPQGVAYIYKNSDAANVWKVIRQQDKKFHSNVITRAYLFNRKTRKKIVDCVVLDYENGKFPPQVSGSLDYITNQDPAVYTTAPNKMTFNTDSRNAWGPEHVGKIWWDTNSVKLYDFTQGDELYKLNNFAETFPNSVISIYQWVESIVPPAEWSALNKKTSSPLYTANDVYTSKTVIDPNTNVAVVKYYFWVRNNKHNGVSTTEIENILGDIRYQQQPYVGVLGSNILGLYNCQNYIDTDVSLMIKTNNSDQTIVHTEWSMFDDGSRLGISRDFYNKLKHSLIGQDDAGRLVPDLMLPEKQKYGTSIRPRQTLFSDKFIARKLFVEQLNQLCKNHAFVLTRTQALAALQAQEPEPVVNQYITKVNDITELGYLDTRVYALGDRVLVYSDITANNAWSLKQLVLDAYGNKAWHTIQVQAYNLSDYWNYADWYSANYNNMATVDYEIQSESDIALLPLVVGDIIRIQNSAQGGWKLAIVTDHGIDLLAQQNATIVFSIKLFNNISAGYGLDATSLDATAYGKDCNTELTMIFDIVVDLLLTGELQQDLKSIVHMMINTMISQVPDSEWIIKTSLVDIYHKVKNLEQTPVYLPDITSSVRDFFNEAKPFHTVLKNYVAKYDNAADPELLDMDITDFDLQPYYNTEYKGYRSPQLNNSLDSVAFTRFPVYQPWLQHHGYELVDCNIVNGGQGYTQSGVKLIVYGDGTGAKAQATVTNGSITDIKIVNPGKNYSYASIAVYGAHTSTAVITAKLGKGLARSITTTMKFDRYTYHNSIYDWAPDTDYVLDQIVVYQDPVFRVTTDHRSNNKFNMFNFALLVVKNYESNMAYSAEDVIVYRKDLTQPPVTYVVLTDFVSGRNLDMTKVRPYNGKWLDNASDRIWGYYAAQPGMPGRDLRQLMRGIDYPGVNVLGPDFSSYASYGSPAYDLIEYDADKTDNQGLDIPRGAQAIDTVYYSQFSDNMLGLRPEDIITYGGQFIDSTNVHAPEELLPGRMYDALAITVTTNSSSSITNIVNPEITQIAYIGDGNTRVYSFDTADTGIDLPASGVEYVLVVKQHYGPLEQGVEYELDISNRKIILAENLNSGFTLFINIWGGTGTAEVATAEYTGNNVTKDFLLPGVSLVDCGQIYVKVNNTLQQNYFVSQQTNGVMINMGFIPANNSNIQIRAYGGSNLIRNFAVINEQVYTTSSGIVNNGIVLADPITSKEPLTVYTIVRVNELYLTPSNQAYYTATGTNRDFALSNTRTINNINSISDNDIIVVLDDIKQRLFLDYTVIRTLNQWPVVRFNNPPALGSSIVISDLSNSDYRTVSGSNLQLEAGLSLTSTDKVFVTTFTSNNMIGLGTWVFTGNNLAQFTTTDEGWDGDNSQLDIKPFDNNLIQTRINMPVPIPVNVTEIGDLMITVNGVLLLPYIDFRLADNKHLEFSREIADTDIIVLRIFSGINRNRNSKFRIFKDLTDTYTYSKIDRHYITELTQDLYITDSWISVTDVNRLHDPDPASNVPGVVFINGERITYYVKDNINNRLGNIRRGTSGTGAPYKHTTGSVVVDAHKLLDIPNTTETTITLSGIVPENTGITYGTFTGTNNIAGTAQTEPQAEISGGIVINNVIIPFTYISTNLAANRSRLVNAINSVFATLKIHATDTGSDQMGVDLVHTLGDAVNIVLSGGFIDSNNVDLGYLGIPQGMFVSTTPLVVPGQAMVTPATNSSGQIIINNHIINFLLGTDNAANRASIVNSINSAYNLTSVIAVDTQSDLTGITLQADPGYNLDVEISSVLITNKASQTVGLKHGQILRQDMLWQDPGQTLHESTTSQAKFIWS